MRNVIKKFFISLIFIVSLFSITNFSFLERMSYSKLPLNTNESNDVYQHKNQLEIDDSNSMVLTDATQTGDHAVDYASIYVSVDQAFLNYDENIEKYSLRVVDENHDNIGHVTTKDFDYYGGRSFILDNLLSGSYYHNASVNIVDTGTYSNTFDIKTNKNSVNSLNEANVDSTTSDSAVLSVNVNDHPEYTEDLEKYSLEVINSDDEVIGESDSNDLTTDGPQTINLTKLDLGNTYENAKIRVKGSTEIVSDPFTIDLKKETVNGLTEASTISTTYNSANISVNVESELSSTTNESIINEYSLEVVNDSGSVIGISDANNLTSNGVQTFNLTELTTGKNYNDAKVRVKDHTDIVSNPFDIIVLNKDVSSLIDATTISTTNNSAIISVNVGVLMNYYLGEEINEYSLEVIDDSEIVIGSSDANKLTTDGIQEFNLTKLEIGKDYNNTKVRVVGTEITSNAFDIHIKKDSISNLENAKVVEDSITIDESTVNVEAKINEGQNLNNIDVEDYTLIVIDKNDDYKVLGDSGPLSTDGEQTINLINLYSNHTYDNVWIQVEGTDISTKIDEWETLKFPFEIKEDSFNIDNESVNKNSFTFTIVINSIYDDNDINDFDTSDLQLFSNGKNDDLGDEIKLEFISLDAKDKSSGSFKYKAIKLSSNKKYDNFKVAFKQQNKKEHNPISMRGSIKTKINVMLYVYISISFLVLVGVVILVSFLVHQHKKNKMKDSNIKNLKFL